MNQNVFGLVLLTLVLVSCRSNPNKAEKIDTTMEISAKVSGAENVGVKKGLMVVQEKAQMSERLRDLQNAVYSLEDKAYGTRKLGSLGLYGQLKNCKRKLASKPYGGSGSMVWTEPLDRVTDKEDELKIGLDEKKDLVGVNEEYLRDRVARFSGYKQILQKRTDEFQDRVEECQADLAQRQVDNTQSTKVLIQEAPKASVDRGSINTYVCSYVHTGASLNAFMLNAFAKGWLSLADFKLEQTLLAPSLKDSQAVPHDNVFVFNGWKLAFDRGPVTLADLLNGEATKDARLQYWSFDHQAEVTNATLCLSHVEGAWNP